MLYLRHWLCVAGRGSVCGQSNWVRQQGAHMQISGTVSKLVGVDKFARFNARKNLDNPYSMRPIQVGGWPAEHASIMFQMESMHHDAAS